MKADPIKLEIYKSLYSSVAEEMGISLRRSAFSPNIKERRDYSCAVFNGEGHLIAQGDHMPVHLGSMAMSVKAALEIVNPGLGEVVVLNDPYAGGTHLPDVTMVSAVYPDHSESNRPRRPATPRKARRPKPFFYVANRAHHSDIGGATPGSMGLSEDICQEGFRIPPVRLLVDGLVNDEVMRLISANVRLPAEREGDLTAQLGAIATGTNRLNEIVGRYGWPEANEYASHLIRYTAQMMRRAILDIPDGVYSAEDFLDDDGYGSGPIKIAVKIQIEGENAIVDFTGSSPQVRGPINAVEAITVSAVYYVFRCLIPQDVPASSGILDSIRVITEPGTIVNARPPAAVAAGNVETSQRIVDTLLLALSKANGLERPLNIPAASQGTMNNLTVGGLDAAGHPFAYYETIAGGMGARPGLAGIDAIHTHMTNSLNTPAEALEYAYPMRVRSYSIRRGSGGTGAAKGGDGICREIEMLTTSTVAMLSDRRKIPPYGLNGGQPGATGRNLLICGGRQQVLDSKQSITARAGDRIRIETPGGGGNGPRQ